MEVGRIAGAWGVQGAIRVHPFAADPQALLGCASWWLRPPEGPAPQPLLSQLSRRHEFEADAFACAQADGRDLSRALLKLHEDNAATLTPDPLYVRFYYSHPPASERLAALPQPA